jgi:hypothetical protein
MTIITRNEAAGLIPLEKKISPLAGGSADKAKTLEGRGTG